MIWIFVVLLTFFSMGVLVLPIFKDGVTTQNLYILICVGASIFLSVGLYGHVGRPDLSHQSALSKNVPELSIDARISAIANMSDEERSVRVDEMVKGLALKLERNPSDPEGWVRLLRARIVLNQQDQLRRDILTVKTVFMKDPVLRDEIISAGSM